MIARVRMARKRMGIWEERLRSAKRTWRVRRNARNLIAIANRKEHIV